jgi:hypothetical protein
VGIILSLKVKELVIYWKKYFRNEDYARAMVKAMYPWEKPLLEKVKKVLEED